MTLLDLPYLYSYSYRAGLDKTFDSRIIGDTLKHSQVVDVYTYLQWKDLRNTNCCIARTRPWSLETPNCRLNQTHVTTESSLSACEWGTDHSPKKSVKRTQVIWVASNLFNKMSSLVERWCQLSVEHWCQLSGQSCTYTCWKRSPFWWSYVWKSEGWKLTNDNYPQSRCSPRKKKKDARSITIHSHTSWSSLYPNKHKGKPPRNLSKLRGWK